MSADMGQAQTLRLASVAAESSPGNTCGSLMLMESEKGHTN